jgi:triosephosphate isomerase
MARIPLIAGNWKLNLDHLEATHTVQKLAWLLQDAKHNFGEVEVVVLPSFTSIRSVQTLVDADKLDVKVGAQDISAQESGAYTGEVSGAQLAKLNVSYVTVGHSERRQYHGETDAIVGAKAKAAFAHGITPIVCVGEGLDIRKEGTHVAYTLAQVDGALEGLTADLVKQLVIAYEPVWAIGTGEVATPADAQEVCAAIRVRVGELYDAEVADAVRVLYGGSVKSGSIAAIMAEQDVDGVLVGGASLDPEEFSKIARFRDHTVAL